jgi:hypothetical protein
MNDKELNEAVARKLGWQAHHRERGMWAEPGSPKLAYGFPLPNYVSDIAAAWEIVASLQPRRYTFRLKWDIEDTTNEWKWFCRIAGREASADGAAEAICKAFLQI